MINIKFINATSVQLKDQNDNVVTTIGEFSGSPIEYTYSENTFSKSPANYYHFVIEGTNVQLSGTIGDVTEDYQYWNLFKGQTAITDASNLTLGSTTAKQFCYANMFKDCINLINSPTISATTLDDWCYQGMFAGCRSLILAPALIATTLAPYCYFAMFYGCSSLNSAPYLPASTLVDWCYNSMFYNCRSLNLITCNFDIWNTNNNSTKNWVNGVSENGYFYAPNNLSQQESVSKIPIGWGDNVITTDTPLSIKALDNDVGVRFVCDYDTGNTLNFSAKYKVNDGEWQTYQLRQNWSYTENNYAGDVINLNKDEVVSFSGTEINSSAHGGPYRIRCSGTGRTKVFGNITLVFKNSSSTYKSLFEGQSNIVDAGGLIINTVRNQGCYKMFKNCTNLIIAPVLYFKNYNSVNDWCYAYMFQNCTSLRTPPQFQGKLNSVGTGACACMFQGCTSLTSAPQLLAKNIGGACYDHMFQNCTSLRTPPSFLPATTIQRECYWGMFEGCTSLTSAPQLQGTNTAISCYLNMFKDCTSLRTSPSILPATELSTRCYYGMFFNCPSLTSTPIISATTLAQRCCAQMFYNCTSLTSVPSLPATTMADYCYAWMFENCSALVNAPQLSATIMASNCCKEMFRGCSSLSNIEVNFINWSTFSDDTGRIDYTTDWVSGVASSGTFIKPSNLLAYRGSDYIPNGWTIVNK